MRNESIRKIINVDQPNHLPIWSFKQEDDGVLRLSLFKGSTLLDITGQTIKLGAKRPNNSIIELTDGFEINSNELDIILKNNILAIPGIVECDLEITDVVGKMTTASFYLTVTKKMTGEDNLDASNDISAINKIVAEVLAKGKELDSNIKVVVEEANKKITAIDTALNKKLNEMQEDYNSLQRIIIDENQAANLQNQVNQTNAQLEHKANKGESISVLQIDKNKGKFDETYMTDEFLQQIAGNTSINSTVAGGGITTEKVAKKGITVAKTNFLKEGKNLFNYETCVDGKALVVTDSNVVVIDSATFSLSEFIEVDSSTNYCTSMKDGDVSYIIGFYDKDRNPISGLSYPTQAITTPSNCCYVRIAINPIENKNIVQFEKGSIKTPFTKYVPFVLEEETIPNKILTGDMIKDKTITKDNVNFLSNGKNLFNKDDCEDGKDVHGGNNAGFTSMVDYIPVTPNTQYIGSGATYYVIKFYDIDKNVISFQNFPTTTITTPENCYFVRIGVSPVEHKNTFQFELGELATSYDIWRPYIIDKRALTSKDILSSVAEKLVGKKWTVLGDSITERNWRTSKNYHKYIEDKYGMTVQNLAKSGRGYDYHFTILEQIDNDTDIITIYGSINDIFYFTPYGLGTINDVPKLQANTTYYSNVKATIEKIIELYPTKKIAIITPIPSKDNYGKLELGIEGVTLKNIANALKEVAELYSIPCLDLYNTSNLKPWNKTNNTELFTPDGQGWETYPENERKPDGIHPNSKGHKIIADRVEEFLLSI